MLYIQIMLGVFFTSYCAMLLSLLLINNKLDSKSDMGTMLLASSLPAILATKLCLSISLFVCKILKKFSR